MIEISNTQEFWSRPQAGEKYNQQFTNAIGWYTNQTETQPLYDLVKQMRDKKILDVGCGTGRHLRMFHHSNDLYGVDQSHEMLTIAKNENQNVRFQTVSAESLPFESNTFDLVYSVRMLQHIRDQKQAISEMVRVLKPNARIVIINYNPWSLLNLYKHLRMSKIGRLANMPFKFILKDRSFFGPWGFAYDNYTSIPELKCVLESQGVQIRECWGLSSGMPWFFNSFFLAKVFQMLIPNIFRGFLTFCLWVDRHLARRFPLKYLTDLILVSGYKTR